MSSSPTSRRTLFSLYCSTMGTWAAYALVIVVLPFRFAALGLSVFEYGAVLAVYALGTLATEGLWGYFAFRLGSSPAILLLGGLTATVMFALILPVTFLGFAALLGLYGLLVVYSTPLIRWMGMTASGPGTESRGLGRLSLFFGLGLSGGTALGPVIYTVWGFQFDAMIATVVFIASTIPLALLPWSSLSLPRATRSGRQPLASLFERGFVMAAIVVVLYFIAYSLVTNFLQYYSLGLFHGTIEEAGYTIAAARAAALVTGVLLGATIDRWGTGRAAPVGFALLAFGALGTALSGSYSEMVLATMVLASGSGWLGVTLLPLALARIPRAEQGTAVGVFGSFEDLGLVLGPILLGAVYSSFGAWFMFPVTAGIALSALVLSLIGWRMTGRPSVSGSVA